MNGDTENNNSKGHNALTRGMWHNNTVRPIQARALRHTKCSITSPWLVPELTGVQWVEPLPQANYRSQRTQFPQPRRTSSHCPRTGRSWTKEWRGQSQKQQTAGNTPAMRRWTWLALKKPMNIGKQTMTKGLLTWDQEDWGPEGYEENEGYISDFFLPVTDSSHIIHVLAPFIKHNGLYCLGTASIGKPVYHQELFTPQCITINKEGEFPHWFFNSLTQDFTYTTMYKYSWTQKDWGITAEFQQFHDTHNNITSLVAEQWSLATTIEALHLQKEQCQRCLLGSHAYKQLLEIGGGWVTCTQDRGWLGTHPWNAEYLTINIFLIDYRQFISFINMSHLH